MPLSEPTFSIPDGYHARIDRVVQELTGRSRAEVRGLFDQGCVRLNNEPCDEAGIRVNPGDCVALRYDPQTRYRERPRQRENSAFRLVHEDNQLLVVDKAAGLLTVPSDRGDPNTLLDAIGRYLNRRGHRGRAAVVHRLDRGASGLLVFGKNPQAARALRDQFRTHEAEREYAALVAGNLARQSGTFSSNLGTTKSLKRYSVRARSENGGEEGERAVTHFRVEKQLDGATYVRVRLETGRRNQNPRPFCRGGPSRARRRPLSPGSGEPSRLESQADGPSRGGARF